MVTLGLNIDHIATIRQARGGVEPDPVAAAAIAELAGADAITVHLREDRRHINDRDVKLLKQTIKTRLNLEMAATSEMQNIALEICPYSVTLVPEKRQELTTEGGLDVVNQKEYLKEFLKPILDKGIIVSLFVDPDFKQVEASAETGAQFIELHTGQYAEAFNKYEEEPAFKNLCNAANLANELGLRINAGHGLNYQNVRRILAIKNMEELNIGHSIVSKAVLVGLEQAVRDMKYLLDSFSPVIKNNID
ncbi:MAG: pyridoxine 5'-phosphate synthase [Candidatus Melainabacteria bacterium RIFOXYA12_FULL_32_12]|nr:MAG: pyridoxine 5'-phosphate synthase [Candidatus Melainabacteria bacterium RIFOXYA2_FULL_32_9]OGI31532.1 MAG: pyridoxine 5'-phosphate synthase [Candidatus Melainabacteria bacterium RIFOXYA12_FULL_32_12]